MNGNFLDIPDDNFWKPITPEKKEETIEKLADSDHLWGNIVEAPDLVNIDVRESLPMYAFRKCSDFENYHYPLMQLLLVYAYSCKQDFFHCALAFSPKEGYPAIIPRPESDFLNGFGIFNFEFDLKKILMGLKWESDDLYIGTIIFNKMSNQIPVKLYSKSDTKIEKTNVNLEYLQNDLIEYDEYNNSSECERVTLDINSSSYSLNDKKDIVLEANFNLPFEYSHKYVSKKTQKEINFIRVFILFKGYQIPGPWIFPIDIPVTQNTTTGKIQTNIKINLTTKLPPIPQTYMIWLTLKNEITGPLQLDLIKSDIEK